MRRAIVRPLAAIGAVYVLVTVTPITLWWARALSNPWLDADGDVLIVLGADAPNGGVIGQSSYWRAVYAVRYWKRGHFKKIIVAGGAGTAETMREFIVCEGVPAAAIAVETRSTSTRENALFTRDFVMQFPGPKVLFTSDYHMYRAQRVFRKAGIDVLPTPFPDALKRGNSWPNRAGIFVELVIETAKIAGYRVRGWI